MCSGRTNKKGRIPEDRLPLLHLQEVLPNGLPWMKQKDPIPFSLDKMFRFLVVIALLLTGAYFFRPVLTPLIFSFFLATLVLPLGNRLERWGINRFFSSLIVVVVLCILFLGGVVFLSYQLNTFIEELPALRERSLALFREVVTEVEALLNIEDLWNAMNLKAQSGSLIRSGGTLFRGAITATSSILTFIGLLPIYVFLILFYRNNFKAFLDAYEPVEGDHNNIGVFNEVKQMTQGYLRGISLVILIIATLNSIGLLILGIDYAIAIGIISAILTIIPYIGIAIGGAIPVIVALVTKDSIWYPIGVLAIYGFIQFVEGNFITPKVVGSNVDINPLAAITGLLVGGMIWGIVGMILAIPLLSIVRIMCEHTEQLRPLAILLNNKKH